MGQVANITNNTIDPRVIAIDTMVRLSIRAPSKTR